MKRRSGFTLIELMIVTAVFSLVALVATTVITRIQTTQRQILGKQRVVADGRYVLETVARAVRQQLINYPYYGSAGPAGSQTVLALKDSTNVETCYRYNGAATPPSIEIMSGAGVTNCTGGIWTDITPADLVIDDFHVYLSPGSDPFQPVPRQSTDCRLSPPVGNPVTEGFDVSRSVCTCAAASAGNDCFTDQACVSTATATSGNNCLTGDASCICQNANEQPEATIVIATRTLNQSSGEKARATIQTTVTSHIYRR